MADQGFVIQKTNTEFNLFKNNQQQLNHLDIELTERCNNACIHCYINKPPNDQKARTNELTTDQWKNLLQQAADLGALSVRFTGGEPLLRDDFEEIYLFTRRLGMKVVLFTNARLITPHLADLFAKIRPLKKIEVSVYGMCENTYDTVAGVTGAYQEYRKGLGLLLERKIPLTAKMVVLPINIDEIDTYESWLDSLPGQPNPVYSFFLDLRARRDSENKNKKIRGLRITPEEYIDLMSNRDPTFCQSISQFGKILLYPPGNKLFPCGAGKTGCIDAYGTYQMCLLLRHPDVVYDLKQGNLNQALTKVFPVWRNAEANNPEYLQRCAICFLKSLCEQCPAKSWMEHGTMDTPIEYHCDIAHAQARYCGLLDEHERAWEVDNWQERIDFLVEKHLSK